MGKGLVENILFIYLLFCIHLNQMLSDPVSGYLLKKPPTQPRVFTANY